MICPICNREDAVRSKDDPRFYKDGRLTAICFHGHGNGRPVTFDAETGALVQGRDLEPWELLYRAAQESPARGLGGAFLARFCSVFTLSRETVAQIRPPVPTEADCIKAADQGAIITLAPLYLGADLVGLEARMVEVDPKAKVTRWIKTLGMDGVYIADPGVTPETVIIFEGVWDAVNAAWDAHEADESARYAFLGVKAGSRAEDIRATLDAHFPGIPAVIISDQDSAGKGLRARLARANVATPAILGGISAKDYREADRSRRWGALLDALDRASNAPPPSDQHGLAKIARRALEGALRGKQLGMRDLEAWRFGQRSAGICKAASGGKRFFGIRARIYGRMPVTEGLHEFGPILASPAMRRIHDEHPDLAATILGGPTESHMSPEWLPPTFLEDGRHWSELPREDRLAYARSHGWECWQGKEVGSIRPGDLEALNDRMRDAYRYVRIPEAPDSEVGTRVLMFTTAVSLVALWAEERWQAGLQVGFLPWVWFQGGPATGKGTAAKIVAMGVTGEARTFGSQRFDGNSEGGWLTESVLHTPVCFRDELDQFLGHTELEDLKTYISGEPLQLRKKFGTDMTIAPKPVVFSSNLLKVNQDDEATKERIILVQLEPNPLAQGTARNNAFESFYAWAFEHGGRDLLHRVTVGLYKDFRRLEPAVKTRWTRSAIFDQAMAFVCERFEVNPGAVLGVSTATKEQAVLAGASWFTLLQDYVRHELAGAPEHQARAVEVWSLNPSNESDTRKLRRWIDLLGKAGTLQVEGHSVKLTPFSSKSTARMIQFTKSMEATHGTG